MQNSSRDLSAEARKEILYNNAMFPVGMIAITWAIYVAASLFDVDLVRLLRRRNRDVPGDVDTVKVYLWIAIGTTVIGLGYAWLTIRRALHLAANGIPIVCEVVKVGRISAHGMVRVDYTYVVDGATYKRSLSCLRETALEYESGSQPLEIVYDPQRPKCAMLKSDVFPSVAPMPDGSANSQSR